MCTGFPESICLPQVAHTCLAPLTTDVGELHEGAAPVSYTAGSPGTHQHCSAAGTHLRSHHHAAAVPPPLATHAALSPRPLAPGTSAPAALRARALFRGARVLVQDLGVQQRNRARYAGFARDHRASETTHKRRPPTRVTQTSPRALQPTHTTKPRRPSSARSRATTSKLRR